MPDTNEAQIPTIPQITCKWHYREQRRQLVGFTRHKKAVPWSRFIAELHNFMSPWQQAGWRHSTDAPMVTAGWRMN